MKIKIRDMTPEQKRAYARKRRRVRAANKAARTARWQRERPLREAWSDWQEAYKLCFEHLAKSPRIARLTPEALVAFCVKAADAYVAESKKRNPGLDRW